MHSRACVIATLLFACMVVAATSTESRLSALPRPAVAPSSNSASQARGGLGRLLFWDPILSGRNDVAGATCHHPDFGYTDGRDLPLGTGAIGLGPSRITNGGSAARPVRRNSPTIVNVVFNGLTSDHAADSSSAPMFWDLRV